MTFHSETYTSVYSLRHLWEELMCTRYETLSTNLHVLCQIENIIHNVVSAKRYPNIATGEVYVRI